MNMNAMQIFETFFIAVVVAYTLTPFMRKIAGALGYLDHPKDNKVHAHPIPLLGGVAIFFAFLIAMLTKIDLISLGHVRAILCGTLILLVIGLIDDRMGMMPNIKLLGQFLAAMVVIKAGLRVEFVGNYYLSVAFTYLWIIGITNSFNLLDNMNGLSAGIAVIAAAFFGIISYQSGQYAVSALSWAVAGGCLGFLRYNFPKASIFMGDNGSLIVGYVLSTIGILGSWKTTAWSNSLLIPLLILGYPIFDTALVSVMRVLEGRSIFEGGKDHSSHRLALLGLRRYRTVLIIYAISIGLGLAAFALTQVSLPAGMAVAACAFIAMLVLGVRLALVDTKQYGHRKR